MGGSAPAMASQISEGFILMSAATLRSFTPGELSALRLEIDKLLREVRSTVPPQDDSQATQARNRKIGRLNSALQVVSAKLTTR